jgi:hypothetical protein
MKKHFKSMSLICLGAIAGFGFQILSGAASGAANHLGEKLVDFVLPAPPPELALGKEFSVKAPGCNFHIARVTTGTILEVPSFISTPVAPAAENGRAGKLRSPGAPAPSGA